MTIRVTNEDGEQKFYHNGEFIGYTSEGDLFGINPKGHAERICTLERADNPVSMLEFWVEEFEK